MSSSLVTATRSWRTRLLRPSAAASSVASLESAILEETRGPLGAVMWRSFRSVLFWAEASPAERRDMFPDGAYERRMADLLEIGLAAPLVEPFEGLAEVLVRPVTKQPVHVAGNCVAIANWARAERMNGTALAFLHAAASCCPFNPALALMAGREARDQARHRLAEAWLDAAVMVSRRTRSWEIYSRAHLAHANMMLARGAFPAARRHGLKARRRAERHGLGQVLAMAHHDMFVIAAECGDHDEAHRSIRAAMDTYGQGHPRLVNLAFDVAMFWMREGYFEQVLPVYRTLLPGVEDRFLPHIQGAIARAAGVCNLGSEHRRAVRSLNDLPVGPGSSEAWLDAAHGAISLSAWQDASEHLNRSLEIARERQERKIEFLAEGLLTRVQTRSAPAAPTVQLQQAGVDDLAADLVGLLPTFAGTSAS